MIEELKRRNEELIEFFRGTGDEAQLKKQMVIKNILSEPNAFKKMPIEMAYNILTDLGISEDELAKIYIALT